MPKKSSFTSLAAWIAAGVLFTGALGATSYFAHAQETPSGGPPAGIQKGPTAEELAAFEKEVGAPIDAFNQGQVEPPAIPEPEFVSDDIKKLVPESDLLKFYCAMTRWKSGDFFLAMDALKKLLIPAVEKARTQGIDISVPDVGGMTSEGTKRVNSICAAKTVADAEKQIKDFIQWGKDSSMASMGNQRSEMETKMRALGDGIKDKVKSQLQPFIDAETAKIEPEINAQAEAIAQSVVAPYQGQQGEGSSPPDPAAIQAEVEAAINAQLGPIIEAKKAEIEKKIRAKADEIVAPDKKKMEDIGNLFIGLDKKINDAIKTGAGRYAKEKKTALTLRRNLILKLMDINIAEAGKQLDANAAQIEDAKKSDPSVKGVADLKAELAQDRKDLQAKLDGYLANDDEAGLASAMQDFGDKWEKVQQQAEKAATEPLSKICGQAIPQFDLAKSQIQPAITQIQSLQAQCTDKTDEACSQVNLLAVRFGTIIDKSNDILTGMDLAKSMCQASDSDPNKLLSLLQKIQDDGQDAMIMGQALDADRSKVLANSVRSACDQALPQLRAARVEIQNNDLVVLKSNLDRCAGKTDAECLVVNAVGGDYTSFKSSADAFISSIDRVTSLCQKSKDENDFEKIFSTLNELNSQADGLMAQADDLKTRQAESSESRCSAVEEKLPDARKQVAEGLKQGSTVWNGLCNNRKTVCDDIRKLTSAYTDLQKRASEAMSQAAAAESDCRQPYSATHDADLTEHLAGMQTAADAMKKAADDLKKQADQLPKGTGIWIEAENEDSFYIKPVSSRPAINMKETNPSWRPPYFGSGDWYLAVEGEWLGYPLNIPKDGVYNVWVRDYVDKFQPRGVRRIILSLDGKTYAVTPETTKPSPGDKGAFGWHKVGSGIRLTAGISHRLQVTKEKTTVGAAILDAFYLTTGNETPPEK